jgi:hypothetical protein
MLIKAADDRSEEMAELKALLRTPGLTAFQKKQIEEEIHNCEKGAWGEHQAAYYLDTYFAGYKNNIILHDLRIVLSNDQTAQIDHLIINKYLDVYILESKNWSQLTVDETGACTTISAGRVVGTESPLEQCRRHAAILQRVFELEPLLKSLAPRQNIRCRVLVGTKCHLKAPHHQEWYLKADAFHTAWEKEFETESTLSIAISLVRQVSRENLMKIGQALLEMHNTDRRDLRKRFGLPPAAISEPELSNPVVVSIPGLAEFVPRWGKDWFVLRGKPTEETKKAIRSAGYRAKQEDDDWVWRLNR